MPMFRVHYSVNKLDAFIEVSAPNEIEARDKAIDYACAHTTPKAKPKDVSIDVTELL